MGELNAFSPLPAPPRGSERYLSFSRKPMTSPLGGNEGGFAMPWADRCKPFRLLLSGYQ